MFVSPRTDTPSDAPDQSDVELTTDDLAPRWAGHLGGDLGVHRLWWRGKLPLRREDGELEHLESIEVDVDRNGQLLAHTWETYLRLPDRRLAVIEGEPAWDWLGDHWMAFAGQTWFERRRELLTEEWAQADREGRAGRLVGYRSRAEARQRAVGIRIELDHLEVLRLADEQPEELRHAAVRVARSWSGSVDDFAAVLPQILA